MPQKLGQHFLKNEAVAEKIIGAIAPKENEVIIEIGPGHGELTEKLLRYPVRVIAIEKDTRLANFLEERFKTNQNIKVLHGDVLRVLPSLIHNSKLIIRGYKLVGNIPYYLTGFLFRMISELPILPRRTVFMVQKEVALRITATPPHMNLLAASIQLWAEPEMAVVVGKNNFSPKPKMDSAVVLLTTRPKTMAPAGRQEYFSALHMLFKQPRKTIINNVTLGFRSLKKCNKMEKGVVAERLKRIGVRPEDRPQNLCVGDIKKIGEMLYNYSE